MRWTCKSRAKLTAALSQAGWQVKTVSRLLHEGTMRKSREGASHPDRNAQFEHINTTAEAFLQRRQPVVSVDTKKKDGEFKNAGQEWQPKGRPETALVHDFPQDSAGKAIPYGVYDMGHNEAWVNVGCDHDTPAFAVASLRRWWTDWGSSVTPTHATHHCRSNGFVLDQHSDETRLCVQANQQGNKIEPASATLILKLYKFGSKYKRNYPTGSGGDYQHVLVH